MRAELFAIGLIGAMACSSALAADRSSATKQSGTQYIIGHVANAAVDHVAIEGESKPMTTLKVTPATTISLDGRSVPANELPEGAPVFAAYDTAGDRFTAKEIRADPPHVSSAPAQSRPQTGSAPGSSAPAK